MEEKGDAREVGQTSQVWQVLVSGKYVDQDTECVPLSSGRGGPDNKGGHHSSLLTRVDCPPASGLLCTVHLKKFFFFF